MRCIEGLNSKIKRIGTLVLRTYVNVVLGQGRCTKALYGEGSFSFFSYLPSFFSLLLHLFFVRSL
ncbi:hypothetical protein Lalb_Chr24g0398311 [Lupinus albus]|uniref:Uncharacterized protein n=1 Tax=Lupinus albus TaxID=3870 RepID=A0A6A4N8S5_LUPAL|nr:hypothetical protein Lalb_Chr24g0398311 [Lupinus albus]